MADYFVSNRDSWSGLARVNGGGVLASWDVFPQALDDYCAMYDEEERPVSSGLKEKLLIIYKSFRDSGMPVPAIWGHGPQSVVFNWPFLMITVSEKRATCLIVDDKNKAVCVDAQASPFWTIPKLNAHISRYFEKDEDLAKGIIVISALASLGLTPERLCKILNSNLLKDIDKFEI